MFFCVCVCGKSTLNIFFCLCLCVVQKGSGNSAAVATSPTSLAAARRPSLEGRASDESSSLYFDIPGVSSTLRSLPNSAPAVSMQPVDAVQDPAAPAAVFAPAPEPEPKRKKYAKEAWPGRAPVERPAATSNLLM